MINLITFSTTWGKAFLGVGSARLRFLTLNNWVNLNLNVEMLKAEPW